MADTRWLDADAAADYLSLRPEAFLRRVRRGDIPAGSSALGGRSTRWSTSQLNDLMSGEKSQHSNKAMQYVQRLEAEKGRTRR